MTNIVTTSEEQELHHEGVFYPNYKWHIETQVSLTHMKASKPQVVLICEEEDFIERFSSVHKMYKFVETNLNDITC